MNMWDFAPHKPITQKIIPITRWGGQKNLDNFDEVKELSFAELRSVARDKMYSAHVLSDCEDEVYRNFEEYNTRTSEMFICLQKDKLGIIHAPHKVEYLLLPYTTRFNSKKYSLKMEARYNLWWDNMETFGELGLYKRAVFCTLTIDPKRQLNLYSGNKYAPKAYNKFVSWLKKFHKNKDISIMCVREFSNTGYIHFHMIIFGIGWIAPHKKITKMWEKYNMGSINFEYALEFQNEWINARHSKKKIKGSIKNYLKKYLSKNLNQSEEYQSTKKFQNAFFWATKLRFCSFSRKPLDLIKTKRLIQTLDNSNVPLRDCFYNFYQFIYHFREIPNYIMTNT